MVQGQTRRLDTKPLGRYIPVVSAYLVFGQVMIAIGIGAVAIYANIWWMAILMILIIIVGLVIAIVNARRGSWFV